MPPPRRFSAAPTLACPHRNKSSSHSSSSLHHTYSIDSSESIITVIPANRGQDLKRTSRGSLSCNSSGGVVGVSGNQMDGSFGPAGSLYALPRSPLSPRSPSRCSPGLLTPNTPNTSEPPTSIELPFSPLTCSSTGQITMIQPPPATPTAQQQTSGNVNSNRILVQASLSDGTSAELRSSSYNLALPREKSVSNSLCVLSGEEDNLSLAVENGTSYNSSRNELENFENDLDDNDGTQTDAELDYEPQIEEDDDPDQGVGISPSDQLITNAYHQQPVNVGIDTQIVDPNSPVICETINDFCARHTREELESLVNQVGYLTISDCYFSERSSTLCMVIEVKEK